MTFTAELSAASSLPVNLTWETSNGTAVAPGDYTASNGRVPLRIPPGETSRTFLVPTVDDALDEEDTETFGVRIRGSPVLGFNATLGDFQATVTVSDNDDPPALQMADVAAREDAGTLVVGVRLDAPSALPVTVGYAVTAGTATEGEDYTAVPAGTLTFAAGTTSADPLGADRGRRGARAGRDADGDVERPGQRDARRRAGDRDDDDNER